MSYSLQGWDEQVPTSEGAAPQTYRYTVSSVRNLPSGTTSEEVTYVVGGKLRAAGFEFWRVRWGSGGTLLLQYRAPRGTPGYASGVTRRAMVERALDQAARSLGSNVRFGMTTPSSSTPSPSRLTALLPPAASLPRWVLGGLAVAVVAGTVAFFAGASTEGVRRQRVRANRRRRR